MSLMASLMESAVRGIRSPTRSVWPTIDIDEWARLAGTGWPFNYGQQYQLDREEIDGSFQALVQRVYKANPIVYAVETARLMLFCQAVFKFRRLSDLGLYGTPELLMLERPWPGGTTADLLTRLMQMADFGGTGFVVRRPSILAVPRPDWMTILLGSNSDPSADAWDIDATIIGFLYHPGGRYSGRRPQAFLPSEVATFIPTPDPMFKHVGIPWMLTAIPEIQGDAAATLHKLKFFEKGATPQVIVSLGDSAADPKRFKEWLEVFEQEHDGASNAYKTMYLAAGAQAQVVGANLRQLDFRATQGAGEVRIANAGEVPATVVGLSEGLAGSSLNAGNYGMAMRRFADSFGRSKWQNACGSLAQIINVPPGSELWYDDTRIPALKEDITDAATVLGLKATAMRTLIDGGFQPDAVVAFVQTGDYSALTNSHTGLLPVQLQPPGAAGVPATGQANVKVLPGEQRLWESGSDVRCAGCGKMLARVVSERAHGDVEIKCPRCGMLTAA